MQQSPPRARCEHFALKYFSPARAAVAMLPLVLVQAPLFAAASCVLLVPARERASSARPDRTGTACRATSRLPAQLLSSTDPTGRSSLVSCTSPAELRSTNRSRPDRVHASGTDAVFGNLLVRIQAPSARVSPPTTFQASSLVTMDGTQPVCQLTLRLSPGELACR